jgi:hypothetical protein
MMSHSFRLRAGVMAIVVLAAVLPSSAAYAEPSVSYQDAVPGRAPAGAASDAVYLDRQGRVISEPGSGTASSAPTAALGCTPESGRDNPHYSSGDVSGHGWWKKGTCTASTAHVYNCLYEFYTDNTWRQKACSSTKQLRPYTGSGDRTVARARCNPTAGLISWRNHVDVDVDGQVDTAEKPMNQADVVCVVF